MTKKTIQRMYAFKVKVVTNSGFFFYVLSAATQSEAEQLAKEENPQDDVTIYVTPVIH